MLPLSHDRMLSVLQSRETVETTDWQAAKGRAQAMRILAGAAGVIGGLLAVHYWRR